jgi:hypothetical protein
LASIREEHGEEDRFLGVQVWAVLPEEVHVFVFMSVYSKHFLTLLFMHYLTADRAGCCLVSTCLHAQWYPLPCRRASSIAMSVSFALLSSNKHPTDLASSLVNSCVMLANYYIISTNCLILDLGTEQCCSSFW